MTLPTREERKLGSQRQLMLGSWQPDPDRAGWLFLAGNYKNKTIHRNGTDPDHISYWKRADLRNAIPAVLIIWAIAGFVIILERDNPGVIVLCAVAGVILPLAVIAMSRHMSANYLNAAHQYFPPPPSDSRNSQNGKP